MLTLRMDALAVHFTQSPTAFKKIQLLFFFCLWEYFKIAIIVTFLIICFYCYVFFAHLLITV